MVTLPVTSFTLAWTQLIEKVRWEEDYRVAGLYIEAPMARVKGSGAGMEPPDSAVLKKRMVAVPATYRAASRIAADPISVHGRLRNLFRWRLPILERSRAAD